MSRPSEHRQPIGLHSATYAFQVRSARAPRPDDTPLMVDLADEQSDSDDGPIDGSADDDAALNYTVVERATEPSSRYRALSRRAAATLLAALLALMACFGWLSGLRDQPTLKAAPKEQRDSELYKAIVERVRSGEHYYDAVGTELRARKYPTRPMFNWRQPTYAFVLANLPRTWPTPLLALLMLTTLALTARWLAAAWGLWPALAVVVLHAGALAFACSCFYFQEAWAGSLIVLALSLYALGRWQLGAAALLAALAFREFALLPCAVALLFAVRERRWREVKLWTVALTIYTALMSLHALTIAHHLIPADFLGTPRTWIGFGGPRFLTQISRFSFVFFFLPPLVTALALPLAVFGYGDWREPGAARMGLTLLGFLCVFGIVGQSFNAYWGLIFLPLLSVGLVRAPSALRDVVLAIVRPQTANA